jgi:hypothetical protein
MKKLIILSILISFASLSFGQRAGNTLVALSVGANIPTGNFASTDIDNPSAGFALTGVNLKIKGLYKVSRRIGIGGMFSGHSNWTNSAAYQSEFEQNYPDLEGWQVNKQRWASGGIFGGIAATLPLSGSLDLMVSGFAGGVLAYSPEIEIIGEENGQPAYIRLYEEKKDGAFAFEVGAALMFETGERQYFIVGADYFYSNPVFSGYRVLEFEDPEEPPTVTTRDYKPTLNSFNITIGYGYYL